MVWPFSRKRQQGNVNATLNAQLRGFEAAVISRLTASMATRSQSMDWDLYKSLDVIRARSRSLSVNNDYARKFLQMCATHVVGPNGFDLKVRVAETDSKGTVRQDGLAGTAIEMAFWDWARRGNCDVTGRYSFFEICNLYIKALARDGEVLLKKVYGRQAGKYNFQLQVLDIDRLDVSYNDMAPRSGNQIKMGVEINAFGTPVAYHLLTKHPGENVYATYSGRMYERVPAEDVYHHFISDRPEQNRGLPWMHSAIIRLQNLGGYEEAAVIAARFGAAKMGFFTTPDGDGTALADDTDAQGNLIQEADPGVFSVLPPGYDFKNFDPEYPHAMFGDFVKANLRGIASGLGVAYNTLSNDLEGVNFSSIRTGVLEERDNWMVIQRWVIETWLDDLFSTWLKFALASGAVKLPNGSALPVAKFDKFNAGTWQGRKWQWVDPTKDMQANILAINSNLKTRTDVASEQGRDFEEVAQQLAREQELMQALGLGVASPAAPEKPAAGADDSAEEDA